MVAVRGHAVIPAGVSSVPARQGGSCSPMDGAVEVRAGSSSRNVLIVETCTQHEFQRFGRFQCAAIVLVFMFTVYYSHHHAFLALFTIPNRNSLSM